MPSRSRDVLGGLCAREATVNSLVLLSGPSCVGKGPLLAAVKRLCPSVAGKLRKVLLYNNRDPRPGEVDGVEYRFRAQEEILVFRERADFIVLEVRPGNFQALAREEIEDAIRTPGIPFLEAFCGFLGEIERSGWLKRDEILSVFLSPLSKEEIVFLKQQGNVTLEDFVSGVMRRKLLRRTQKQKGSLSRRDLDDIEKRVGTAYEELRAACRYDYVIPNHDGEDSENWDQFYYPIGDARKALLSFVDVLDGKKPRFGEKWPRNLIP